MSPLLFLGSALSLIGGIWFMVAAFQESIVWGLACLFLPVAWLFFLFLHWGEAKQPFLLSLAGAVCVVIAKTQLNAAS
jgi:hypothetical protein